MRPIKISLAQYAADAHMEYLLDEYAPDNPLPPDSIGYQSTIKVKWLCSFGHVQIESPYKRVRRGFCSVCGKERRGSFAQNYPGLLYCWSEQNHVDPFGIPPTYSGFILWKCEKGHLWSRRIAQQLRSAKCPHCSSLLETRPELADEWDAENNPIGIKPHQLPAFSNKEYAWVCKNGHSYIATPTMLTRRQYRCTVCASFGFNYPELAAEWHPTKNGKSTPYDYLVFSQAVVWFLCPHCNHEYQSRIAARVKRKSSRCPFCR